MDAGAFRALQINARRLRWGIWESPFRQTGPAMKRASRLWICVLLAAASVPGQVVVPDAKASVPIDGILAAETGTFAFGDGVVYELSAESARLAGKSDGVVRGARRIGGDLWMLNAAGNHAGPVTVHGQPVELGDDRVIDVVASGSDVWCATPTGAWRLRDGTATRIPDEDLRVNDILVHEGRVWLATSRGAWRIEGDTPTRITDEIFVPGLSVTRGRVWVSAASSLLAIQPGGSVDKYPLTDSVVEVFEVDEVLWAATRDGIFNVDRKRATPLLGVSGRFIGAISRTVGFIAVTSDGAWDVRDGEAKQLIDAPVKCFASGEQGTLWIGGPTGLFAVDDGGVRRLTTEAFDATGLARVGSTVWVGTPDGLRRVDTQASITPHVTFDSGPWLETIGAITGETAWSTEELLVDFSHGHKDPRFEAIVATDGAALTRRLAVGDFRATPITLRDLQPGEVTLHIAVRDRFGNLRRMVVSGKVVRSFPAFVAWLLGAWLVFMLATLAFASRSPLCHRVLMNRWMRNLGSFGIIPLLLRVRRVREHLIEPYVLALRGDRWSQGAFKYATPSQELHPDELLQTCAHVGPTAIVGELGLGKTALLRNVYTRAVNDDRDEAHRAPAPVLMSLGLGPGGFEAAFAEQLARLGGLTDRSLCRALLRLHRFVILVDGWDRMEPKQRERATRYIRHHAGRSFVIVAADPTTVPSGFHRIDLPAPNEALVRKILTTMLPPADVETVTELVEAHPHLALPQHLAVLSKVVETGGEATGDLRDLYAAYVEPALEAGDGEEWPAQLCADAYDGINDGDIDGFRPIAVVADRGRAALKAAPWTQGRRFEHPTIGAYLAAKHIAKNWSSEPALPWRTASMPALLRFLVLELAASGDQVPDCVTTALQRDPRLGEAMLTWLANAHPDLHEQIHAGAH